MFPNTKIASSKMAPKFLNPAFMLRRFSDVAMGSIEKLLNLNGNDKEKKRKLPDKTEMEGLDKENFTDSVDNWNKVILR